MLGVANELNKFNKFNSSISLSDAQIKRAPFTRITPLKSLGGIPFVSFAKDNQYNKDLYHDLVAPNLKTNLWTETWQRGINLAPLKICRIFKDPLENFMTER